MHLYKQYLKEREGIDIEYTDDCFITYKKYPNQTVAIIDIYSKPEIRGKQVMKKLVEDLIKKWKGEGIKTVFGYTDETTQGWEKSEKLMLKFGFKFLRKLPDNRNEYVLPI